MKKERTQKRIIELSRLNPNLNTSEIIDFMLDNGFLVICNDYAPSPQLHYNIDDLYEVWHSLKRLIK